MANTILQIRGSDVPSRVPAANTMVAGEIAINYADGYLFYKSANANVYHIRPKLDYFGTISAQSSIIIPDTENDTLTLLGNGLLEITGDVSGDRVIFNVSPSVFTHANAAFNQANTGVTNAAAAQTQATTARNHANSAFAFANTAYAEALNVLGFVEVSMDWAISAFAQANTSRIHANNAFAQANTSRIHANNAFTQANTATTNASNAQTHANQAFAQANTGVTNATTASTIASAAFAQANTARTTSNNSILWNSIARPSWFGHAGNTITYDSGVDANTIYTIGQTRFINPSGSTNIPFTGYGYVAFIAGGDNSSRGLQIAGDPDNLWWREFSKANIWKKIWTDTNDGSGSGLDADLLDGLHGASYMLRDPAAMALATPDLWVHARVIRNQAAGVGYPADGLFIGYANFSSGLTRIYSGGSASGHYYSDSTGNILRSDGAVYFHTSNFSPNLKANLASPVFTGSVSVRDSGSTGYSLLNTGTASQAGYVAWHTAEGTRRAYMGWKQSSANNIQLVAENSWGISVEGPSKSFEFNTTPIFRGAGTTDGGQFYIKRDTLGLLSADIIVEMDGDFFRIREDGGSGRSVGFDLATSSSGSTLWHSSNDGAGSTLDADLLDGQHGSFYQNASNLNAGTIPDARISGAYTGITTLNMSSTLTCGAVRSGSSVRSTMAIPRFEYVHTGATVPAFRHYFDGNAGIFYVQSATSDAFTTTTTLMTLDTEGDVEFIGQARCNGVRALVCANTGITPATGDDVTSTVGFFTRNDVGGRFVYNSVTPLTINRKGSDGTLIDLRAQGVSEGSISVSGTTVSFTGGHLARWSRLMTENKDKNLLKGTLLSNLDKLIEWYNEDGTIQQNEQVNYTKISDIEGDPDVAGIFVNWDDPDDPDNLDFYLGMTGDNIIRIQKGIEVKRGDLLMSAGDGTAKPQEDDIIRSKTIAKVISTYKTYTYDDGSYCVPCVLMAC